MKSTRLIHRSFVNFKQAKSQALNAELPKGEVQKVETDRVDLFDVANDKDTTLKTVLENSEHKRTLLLMLRFYG